MNCKLDFLENLYISPLESCNLNCRHCYTTKTKNILTNRQILSFISRYSDFIHKSYFINLKSVLFCGGEVFVLKDFVKLINSLLAKNIFITVITNGTIDKLDQIKDPQNCQLIVSLDGPEVIHDQNRGLGNFQKSVGFIRHALDLGFPVEIFYLVTKDSYPYLKTFNLFNLKITYLVDRLGSLTSQQTLDLLRHYPTYPSQNFGCYQLALQSDGQIYGCCESNAPLASISDSIDKIIKNFKNSLTTCSQCPISSLKIDSLDNSLKIENCKLKINCHGCCQPDYFCNFKKLLSKPSCQSIINLL